MACNDVSRLFFFFYELIYTFHLFDYGNSIIAHSTEEVLLLKPADRWICSMCLCSYIRKMLICVNTEWIFHPVLVFHISFHPSIFKNRVVIYHTVWLAYSCSFTKLQILINCYLYIYLISHKQSGWSTKFKFCQNLGKQNYYLSENKYVYSVPRWTCI